MLQFVNQSDQDRLVAWIDFDLVPVANGGPAPGGPQEITTHEGHRFLIVGPDGSCLAMYAVGNHGYRVDLR